MPLVTRVRRVEVRALRQIRGHRGQWKDIPQAARTCSHGASVPENSLGSAVPGHNSGDRIILGRSLSYSNSNREIYVLVVSGTRVCFHFDAQG